jgi:hypothetical protein
MQRIQPEMLVQGTPETVFAGKRRYFALASWSRIKRVKAEHITK